MRFLRFIGSAAQRMLDEVVQLPVTIYTDTDILKSEMDSVFRHYPMLVGHAFMVQEPGSFLLSDWESFSYIIISPLPENQRSQGSQLEEELLAMFQQNIERAIAGETQA